MTKHTYRQHARQAGKTQQMYEGALRRNMALEQCLREVRESLDGLCRVIDSAGVQNLSNGVQLGPTVWLVKCNGALSHAWNAIGKIDETLGEKE